MQTTTETKTKKRHVSAEEAAELTGISIATLRRLKAQKLFTPGKEYIYITGTKGGPLGWIVEAIQEWQAEQSRLIESAPQQAADEIETYAAMGV